MTNILLLAHLAYSNLEREPAKNTGSASKGGTEWSPGNADPDGTFWDCRSAPACNSSALAVLAVAKNVADEPKMHVEAIRLEIIHLRGAYRNRDRSVKSKYIGWEALVVSIVVKGNHSGGEGFIPVFAAEDLERQENS